MHLLPELYVTPRLADVEKPRFSAVPLVPRLLSHRRVKRSPHDLQFNAAAYSQLVWDNVDQNDQDNHLLIVSPYNENLHLLDLTTLDDPDQILATALTLMRPIRNDYATASYQDSFNWRQIFELMKHLADARDMHWKAHSFYVVTFRSKRSSVPSSANIHELDAQAHREAIASGGLLKYWFGSPDVLGHNLATCIWRSREDAKRGGAGAGHARAMMAARTLYEHFDFVRFALTIEDGFTGWHFSEWKD